MKTCIFWKKNFFYLPTYRFFGPWQETNSFLGHKWIGIYMIVDVCSFAGIKQDPDAATQTNLAIGSPSLIPAVPLENRTVNREAADTCLTRQPTPQSLLRQTTVPDSRQPGKKEQQRGKNLVLIMGLFTNNTPFMPVAAKAVWQFWR